jgi:hypothetical protein
MPQNFDIKTTFRAIDKSTRAIGKIQGKLIKFTAIGSRAMRRLNRVTSRLTKTVTRGLKYGFASAATVTTGLFLAINRTAESMDALAKRARTIDFPIEKFQEYRFVAEQSGVQTEVFEKSMQKFARVIGDAKNGTGSLYTILRKNDRGLLRQIRGTKDTSEAFEIMVDSIRKVEDPTRKASLAAATFGRAGVDMINMANLGADEIEKLRKQMRENGIVTAEQAEKAEAYNDMMNRVKKTVVGFMVDGLTPLMPIITDVADHTRAWMVENRKIITSKFKAYLDWLVKNFSKIVDYAKKTGIAIGIFYGISMAVKVANTAMTLFNTLANINLGPLKAVGAFMGKTLPMKIGASTAAVGIFQTALIGLGAFVAGWAIGTILHEKLVEPFMKARHQAKMLRAEHEHTMSGDLAKRNEAVLEGDLTRVNKLIAAEEKALQGRRRNRSYISGMASMYGGSADILDPAEATLRNLRSDRARLLQARNIARYSGGDPVSDEWNIVTHQETSTTKEEVEITIKDETTGKRATVTKGSSGRLKLAHTGGMP